MLGLSTGQGVNLAPCDLVFERTAVAVSQSAANLKKASVDIQFLGPFGQNHTAVLSRPNIFTGYGLLGVACKAW